MGMDQLDQTFKELGIDNFGWQKEDLIESNVHKYDMSVRTYSSFFRILYNASYLTPNMSEKALELLSQTTYGFGIKDGVPKGITVARKFGERSFTSDSHQLHDCGIVYYPSHPYLLCVMSRGQNMETLKEVIQETSSKIYTDLDTRYKKQ
jgi:beta-lactamase class A